MVHVFLYLIFNPMHNIMYGGLKLPADSQYMHWNDIITTEVDLKHPWVNIHYSIISARSMSVKISPLKTAKLPLRWASAFLTAPAVPSGLSSTA